MDCKYLLPCGICDKTGTFCELQKQVEAPKCAHHWVYNVLTQKFRCTRCGEERYSHGRNTNSSDY